MIKFAIVTPVKDEINHFPKTVKSILNQDIKPQKWIIIDDGSSDGTTEVIKKAEKENDWIEGIYREPNKNRKPGGEFVLGIGLENLILDDYDYIVRMDGDLEFGSNYFRVLFEKFDENPMLGIARFHTRGPLKTYRTQCFKDINGLLDCLGWDSIDELKANMLHWNTQSFTELKIHHLKRTQSSQGLFKGAVNHGKANYNSGYHPIFVFIKSLHWFIKRSKLQSIGLFWGYFSLFISRKRKPIDKNLQKFVYNEQIKKLIGKKTIWH